MNTFSEKQRFTQWWIWLIIIAINLLLLFTLLNIISSVSEKSFQLADVIGLTVVFLSLILVNLLITFSSLSLRINSNGIFIKFFPYHFSEKHFTWEEITLSYIREYSPIGEFGGWGYRLGIMGNGKAYNVKGNMGLQLQFQNGKKILIGTQKAEEIKQFLVDIKQYKE